MKTKLILTALLLFFAVFAPHISAQTAAPSPSPASTPQVKTVSVTVEDLQIFRQAKAERDSLKSECKELTEQKKKAEASAAEWEGLFQKATYRADVTQETRITELQSANSELTQSNVKLTAANTELHNRHKTDLQEVANLRFDNKKLKGSRWKMALTSFIVGNATGFAGGFYLGNTLGSPNINIGKSLGGMGVNQTNPFQPEKRNAVFSTQYRF